MKNLNVTKAENKNKKMPMNFGPVDNICFFVYIYFFFFSSIEMQDVKNGSMPFNQVKNNNMEREKKC